MIDSNQRSYLKKLAHDLEPMVHIGKAGLNENVKKQIDDYLNAHEIVKVKIQEGSDLSPKETANWVAEILHAEFVQAIGRKFTIYRKSADNPKIELPKAKKR